MFLKCFSVNSEVNGEQTQVILFRLKGHTLIAMLCKDLVACEAYNFE